MSSNKRKWKVYTTDELRDRFQAKPGAAATASDDPQKAVVPNLKRRNSAPPGMIHFPPGTFSASAQNPPHSNHAHNRTHSPQPQQQQSPPAATRQQPHELVTHPRSSPTFKTTHSYSSRLEKRRASLPYIPPAATYNITHSSHSGPSTVPAIESYLTHFQQVSSPQPEVDLRNEEEPPLKPHSPTQPLPSFQSLLDTIKEDVDEDDDKEIKEIEERALRSKSYPTFKETKPQQPQQQQPQQPPQQSHQIYSQQNQYPQDLSMQDPPLSPSSKFYKNSISKSSDSLSSLSRMSISDIIG